MYYICLRLVLLTSRRSPTGHLADELSSKAQKNAKYRSCRTKIGVSSPKPETWCMCILSSVIYLALSEGPKMGRAIAMLTTSLPSVASRSDRPQFLCFYHQTLIIRALRFKVDST